MAKAKRKRLNTETESPLSQKRLAINSFTQHDLIKLSPCNPRQKKLWKAFREDVKLILLRGYPGTGKTYSSLWLALDEVFRAESKYKQVVIIRSAVETRGQGFLPGELDEKEEPYKALYRDIVDELIVSYNRSWDNVQAVGKLKFMTTTHLRGKTIDDAIILVDEINNMDWKELHTVITRCGKNSRMILMGDEAQEDLSRIRQVTGMPRLKNVLMNMPSDLCEQIDFKVEDILRSGLVQEFVMADLNTPL